MSPAAVLIDFGGVLTTSVLDAFRTFSEQISGDPSYLERLFREDSTAGSLLVEHECGRLSEAEFERRIVALLAGEGVAVGRQGFIATMQAELRPDEAMLAAVRRLRGKGVPVALVSNSLGDDCYRGFDLDELADVSVISAEIGARKPQRRIYQVACDRLGREPAECLMIDDLELNLAGAARLGIHGLHHTDSARTISALADLFGIAAP